MWGDSERVKAPNVAQLNADDLADDCRGGARQTQWDEPNPARSGWLHASQPARSYFTQLGKGMSAEGLTFINIIQYYSIFNDIQIYMACGKCLAQVWTVSVLVRKAM